MIGMILKLTVKPGMRKDLVEFLEWDAAVAKRDEPETLRFDAYPTEDENVIFLYEAYSDSNGFETHKLNEPFKAFAEIRERCIESIDVLVAGATPLATNVVSSD